MITLFCPSCGVGGFSSPQEVDDHLRRICPEVPQTPLPGRIVSYTNWSGEERDCVIRKVHLDGALDLAVIETRDLGILRTGDLVSEIPFCEFNAPGTWRWKVRSGR